MNSKNKSETEIAVQSPQHFRIFMLRVILTWMLLVFAIWMLTKHLPSQYTFETGEEKKMPVFLAEFGKEKLLSFATLTEVIFSATLIILLFLPRSRTWLYVHIAGSLLFCLGMFVIRGIVVIPLTAYVLLIVSLLFFEEKKFAASLDFLLTMLIVLIIMYAARYFVQWYTTFHNPAMVSFIEFNKSTYTPRIKALYAIVPWFYGFFAILIVRIFTRKFNKILFIVCFLLLVAEYYLNNFFDPGLTFMLFPFINWENLFTKFNKRFEPK
jgi:hypothetical protein